MRGAGRSPYTRVLNNETFHTSALSNFSIRVVIARFARFSGG